MVRTKNSLTGMVSHVYACWTWFVFLDVVIFYIFVGFLCFLVKTYGPTILILWSELCECSDESLLFTEADVVNMLFSSGTLLCQDVCLLIA